VFASTACSRSLGWYLMIGIVGFGNSLGIAGAGEFITASMRKKAMLAGSYSDGSVYWP
jgi:hypothetical protein